MGLWVNGNKKGNLEGEQDRLEEGEKMRIEGCDDSRDYICPQTHTHIRAEKRKCDSNERMSYEGRLSSFSPLLLITRMGN